MSTDFVETIGKGVTNYISESGFFSSFFKGVLGRVFGKTLAAAFLMGAGCITHEIIKLFKKSKANAKIAGGLLACALVLRDPFRSQSVSLVGFSLGCQVIKTCLKTLRTLNATDVIQNVTFLGAAIDLPDKEKTRAKMIDTFSSVVNGEIKNVHTKLDWILALNYTPCELDWAMGRNEVFTT